MILKLGFITYIVILQVDYGVGLGEWEKGVALLKKEVWRGRLGRKSDDLVFHVLSYGQILKRYFLKEAPESSFRMFSS